MSPTECYRETWYDVTGVHSVVSIVSTAKMDAKPEMIPLGEKNSV